jgi:hypothetical protein
MDAKKMANLAQVATAALEELGEMLPAHDESTLALHLADALDGAKVVRSITQQILDQQIPGV